ncbi:hypothetical protein FALBO_11425 [Fusarium albosuccineum]|uniref:Uncharacterized protein n=1 Tax=Fusarium albosuccineum TaxID=1237068 RepID=A0A8H4L5X9_9HYPO|nr:hypothetical protein FALBO_11425 [Fusarium albosuccineum]
MCGYVLFLNLCGCYGELQFETSCARIFEELNRINDPESWTPETISELPFSFPDYCVPGWHNTRIILTYGVCCAQWWFDCPSVANPTYPYLYHPVDIRNQRKLKRRTSKKRDWSELGRSDFGEILL